MTSQRSPHRGHHPVGTVVADGHVRTTQVSLLAATALGLAFSSGAADGNVHTLRSLGAPDPTSCSRPAPPSWSSRSDPEGCASSPPTSSDEPPLACA
jgi:hypothetical protein